MPSGSAVCALPNPISNSNETDMKHILLLCTFFLAWSALPANADPSLAEIKQQLAKALPGLKPDEIKPAPVAGLYEVVAGTQVLYVSKDGKYLFMGEMIDVGARRNLTEARRGKLVVKALDGFGEQNMVVIAPPQTKRTITVFTDVDCPYCARLHREVPQLTANGVKVRYVLFPRNGPGTETFKRSVAVWCAKDRVEAMGVAKGGGKIEMSTCANPVLEGFQLGQEMGVRGTPTIVLDDGHLIPGYSPAAELLAALGLAGSTPKR